LQDPTVDLIGVPEFSSRIEVYPLIYVSHIERAARKDGNLLISEIKTSQHELMPDHLLQVWGYCLSAPGGLIQAFGNNYKAKRIDWQLIYQDENLEKPRKIVGPFAFNGYALDILDDAMLYFSSLYRGLKADDLPGPSSNKCKRCGFSWNCEWRLGIDESEDIDSDQIDQIEKSGLLVLQQVGFRRVKAMITIGIKSINDICEAKRGVLRKLPGSSDWHVDRWIQQAEAIMKKKNLIIETPYKQKLNTKDMICYDIETNGECNRIWIIGAFDFFNRKFYSFFAKKDEIKILKEFESFLKNRHTALLVSYSGCYFERRIITERAEKYKLNYLITRIEKEIDMGMEMPNILIGNFHRYKLKDLGTMLGFKFRHPEIDGLFVGNSYSYFLETGEELDWKTFIEYNEDDVMGLRFIINYIQNSGTM
jgi:uncharacterized protein YprB with RNaseH-like and TPR domain